MTTTINFLRADLARAVEDLDLEQMEHRPVPTALDLNWVTDATPPALRELADAYAEELWDQALRIRRAQERVAYGSSYNPVYVPDDDEEEDSSSDYEVN